MSETSPPPSEAAIQTAARLLAAGRASEAADRLQQLVDEAPTYAAAHVLLASALDASGRITEALEIWRRAAFLVPHSPLVHRERQRLVDAHHAAPAEASQDSEERPVDPWNEDAPPIDASSEEPNFEDELATPEADAPPIELAAAPSVPPESASSTYDTAAQEPEGLETPPEPAAPPAQESLASSLEDHEAPTLETETTPVEDSPPVPEAVTLVEEPLETPLLPPEGVASSAPPPRQSNIELEDDGWTILEDDIAPPSADVPVAASLLPPEPSPLAPPPPSPEPESALEPELDIQPESAIQPEPEDVPEPPTPDASIADDLDDLITQLDSAPRIKPDPTFTGPKVTFNESSMDDMVSETLAKIYAAQHQYVEAAVVYEKLAAREPEQADTMLERAAEMRDKAS